MSDKKTTSTEPQELEMIETEAATGGAKLVECFPLRPNQVRKDKGKGVTDPKGPKKPGE